MRRSWNLREGSVLLLEGGLGPRGGSGKGAWRAGFRLGELHAGAGVRTCGGDAPRQKRRALRRESIPWCSGRLKCTEGRPRHRLVASHRGLDGLAHAPTGARICIKTPVGAH